MDIIKVIDGERRVNPCVMGLENCDIHNPCALHKLIGVYKSNLIKVLEITAILDLIKGKQKKEEFFMA